MFSQARKEFWHNPWALGLSGVIIAGILSSGALIVFALRNAPSLVDKQYYESGRKYEQTVSRQLAARNALAWKTTLSTTGEFKLGMPNAVSFTVQDRQDQAVGGAKVTFHAFRPSDSKADFTTDLTETSAGQYSGTVTFALKGNWEISIRIKRGDDVFEATQKIQVTG